VSSSSAAPLGASSDLLWEEAYRRFETPEEEISKFMKRLQQLGADRWPKDSNVVELFCGRGNGLHALARLGFTRVQGIDLSPTLVAQYQGPGICQVGDCRQLTLEDSSQDIVIVQGGLHHLQTLPDDLERTLAEARRVLRLDGRLVIVEPWLTPFLRFVHVICESQLVRRLWPKLDALATMIHYERATYERWLNQPQLIRVQLARYFQVETSVADWGKLMFVGRKRHASA